MSQTDRFIERLEALKEGERSRLRGLAGRDLDETVPGFDLFTGLWWPLRRKSQAAPRRETSWLVAKLFGAFPIPQVRPDHPRVGATLAHVLGSSEPRDDSHRKRFRQRFDGLLQAPLSGLEPHLRWALSVVADAVQKERCPGLDWAQLLHHLSIWDRGDEHRLGQDVQDIWAEEYLNAVHQSQRRS